MKSQRVHVGSQTWDCHVQQLRSQFTEALFLRQFLKFLEIRKEKGSWVRQCRPLIPALGRQVDLCETGANLVYIQIPGQLVLQREPISERQK